MCVRAARPGMGIATDQTFENKGKYRQFLDSFSGGTQAVENAASRIFAPLAKISASHPINEAREGDGYFTDIINWCMLDIPHLLLQLGFDLFAEIEKEVV